MRFVQVVARRYDRLATAYDGAWLVYLRKTTARLLDGLPADIPQGAGIRSSGNQP